MGGLFCPFVRSERLSQRAGLDVAALAAERLDVGPAALDLVDDHVLVLAELGHLAAAGAGLLVDLQPALLAVVDLALVAGAIALQEALVHIALRAARGADIGKGILHLAQIEHLAALLDAGLDGIGGGRTLAHAGAIHRHLQDLDLRGRRSAHRHDGHGRQQGNHQYQRDNPALHNNTP